MKPIHTSRKTKAAVAVAVVLGSVTSSGLVRAQAAKTFLDYIKPAPIVCSPLSSATWGVAGVLPRDICNGIESAKGAAVPPEFYYWDGQILKAKDGKYHMFMSTWSGTAGFNPGWMSSDAYHAISSQGVLGPYERQGFVYSNNGSHKGHNVSALELPDGTYAVVVSEIVPFAIYTSSSLDGPWTGCTPSIQANGVNAGTDTHYDSNVSLIPRHDGKFEIVQRHGLIAIADTLCGPYKMQKPTWAYPAANRPTIDSIYPRRTSIPGVSNPTFQWEEDPHIWRSGGVYHVLYSGSGDRVGWHVYSADGVTNWTDGGLAFSPRSYDKIFGYEGSTTKTQWYKMERPGVVLQDGHPTHITWAVADVDKDNQIPAGSNHGSKVIVVPFDGVTFDNDYGTGAGGGGGTTGAGGASGGTAGSTAAGGRAGGSAGVTGGSGGRGGGAGGAKGGASGGAGTGGAGGGSSGTSTGGAPGSGGKEAGTGGAASGGATAISTGGAVASSGGVSATGGAVASGGAPGRSGSGGGSASGGISGSGSGGAGPSPQAGAGASGGCSCALGGESGSGSGAPLLPLGLLAVLVLRCRHRSAERRRR